MLIRKSKLLCCAFKLLKYSSDVASPAICRCSRYNVSKNNQQTGIGISSHSHSSQRYWTRMGLGKQKKSLSGLNSLYLLIVPILWPRYQTRKSGGAWGGCFGDKKPTSRTPARPARFLQMKRKDAKITSSLRRNLYIASGRVRDVKPGDGGESGDEWFAFPGLENKFYPRGEYTALAGDALNLQRLFRKQSSLMRCGGSRCSFCGWPTNRHGP